MKKPSIGILYGYGSKTELTEVGATHIVNDKRTTSFLFRK